MISVHHQYLSSFGHLPGKDDLSTPSVLIFMWSLTGKNENLPWVWLGVEDTESGDVKTMLLKSARVSGQQDRRKKSAAVADF